MTWTRTTTLMGLLIASSALSARADDPLDLDILNDDDLSVITSEDRRDRRLDALKPRDNGAFEPGERLVYSVRYGIIRAGEAMLAVERRTTFNGRPCYHLVATAQSNDFFSGVFKVDDRMESYLDVDYLLPWMFEKRLHEGGYQAYQRIELDQINQLATYQDGNVVEMEASAQDYLSVLYYLRAMDLAPGTKASLRTHADKKNVDLEVEVIGREEVETPAGTFSCLVVEPHILLDTGLYDSKKGKLLMYLTDDERKLPVLFKIKVFFGSLILTLTDLEEGNGDHGTVP